MGGNAPYVRRGINIYSYAENANDLVWPHLGKWRHTIRPSTCLPTSPVTARQSPNTPAVTGYCFAKRCEARASLINCVSYPRLLVLVVIIPIAIAIALKAVMH